MQKALPIDVAIPQLTAAAREHRCLVVEAPPGAGKTTRVPPALWHAGLWSGETWVTEPRKLAAKLMAHHVSSEQGTKLGELVGYTVRFDDRSSGATRIRYVTSGILLRRLLSDPTLSGIDCVVLDEFHERHLDSDLALALVRRLQERRPELRLVVMSATLDGERISKLLDDCPRYRSEGKLYPLQIEFEPQPDDRPLEKRISSALRRIYAEKASGHTLVFLPGAGEIRRTRSAIEPLCAQANLEVAVLHGDLGLEAQAQAIAAGPRPRVVLTTNIAESSITVDGVTAVIDCGLSRQRDDADGGVMRLSVQKISRASAVQRAGRAGRVAPGRVLRLYSKGDFDTRPEFETPEILRVDFAEALLTLLALLDESDAVVTRHGTHADVLSSGESDLSRAISNRLDSVSLLDRPSNTAIASAAALLQQLGALDGDGRLTPLGRRMAGIALPPRLARFFLECDHRALGDVGALVAALLTERDLRLMPHRSFELGRQRDQRQVVAGESDVAELVELFARGIEAGGSDQALRAAGLDPGTFRAIRNGYEHLRRLVRGPHRGLDLSPDVERELGIALLVSFPDRIAKRRTPQSNEFTLRTGVSARLDESSVVQSPQWLVAVDVEQRREFGRTPESLIRIASAFREEWLLDELTDQLSDDRELLWIDPPGRVEERSRIRLGSLTVEESRRAAKPNRKVAELLLAQAERAGLLQDEHLTQLFVRLRLLNEGDPALQVPEDMNTWAQAVVLEVLASRIDLDGLTGTALAAHALYRLPPALVESLQRQAPEAVAIGKGRRCPIHYEVGRPPWIASRLQDFFGLAETPTILSGRRRLVLHLLAPNQRAVQITDDLRGFWSRHYPEIRRQLLRRYPRHSWPEDGLTASPPDPRPAVRR